MKKTYQKPMMAVELFAMTQSIASCDLKIGFLNSECVKNDPDATNQMKDLAWSGFFMECDTVPTGMDEYDGLCYHTNANSSFSS